ncbi:hypothetical protein G6F37_006947 [Rhizopus arrhizus]|nr:hypothetical protein G6F38_002355 [Rhizopus arrhizus]KAG1157165.1 hypothetical protein G6F37_006947 [Rhizopus arrhizus]
MTQVKSVTILYGPVILPKEILQDSESSLPDLILYNPETVRERITMCVSFELEAIINTTSINLAVLSKLAWKVSFLEKEKSCNEFLENLFLRDAKDTRAPTKAAIFKTKSKDAKVKDQLLLMYNQTIGEQTFLYSIPITDSKLLGAAYNDVGDIVYKEIKNAKNDEIGLVSGKMRGTKRNEKVLNDLIRKRKDRETARFHSANALFELSNDDWEEQWMMERKSERMETANKFELVSSRKRPRREEHEEERTSKLARLSSVISVDQGEEEPVSQILRLSSAPSVDQGEEKLRIKSKVKKMLGKKFSTERFLVIYQSVKFHFLPCIDKIDDEKLTNIIKSHIAFHEYMDSLLQI